MLFSVRIDVTMKGSVCMKGYKLRECIPVEKIGEYIENWHKKKPDFVEVSTLGKSGDYDIYSAVFTNKSIPDDNKQIAIVTAQHSGMEISGMTTAFSLGNFLMTEDKTAKEILDKMIVVLVPCPNPYSYSKQDKAYQFKNEFGVDEYVSFNYEGAKKEGKNPAATALQALIDKYKPEIFLDLHGVWFDNQLVIESFGMSAFACNKLFNDKLMNRVRLAGTKEGFASFDNNFAETLPQTDNACTSYEVNSKFTPQSTNGVVAPTYAYINYHTMGASFEIAWEEHGLAKVIEALKIGCEVNEYEYYPGYPSRTVKSPYGHVSIRSYGVTAKERRESRCELWKHRQNINLGVAHPEVPGFMAAIISLTEDGSKKYVRDYYRPLKEVCEEMDDIPGVDMEKLLGVFTDDMYEPFCSYGVTNHGAFIPENGMTIRFMLPFADASVKEVMYNGNALGVDEACGYTIVKDQNYVFCDVHIPKSMLAEFAVCTVKYDCTTYKCGIVEFE